jgi:Family of unknown function (DUF6131)
LIGAATGTKLPVVTDGSEHPMLVLGVILLILGWILNISILWTIGIILIVVGAVLYLLGAVGRPIGPRRHYW